MDRVIDFYTDCELEPTKLLRQLALIFLIAFISGCKGPESELDQLLEELSKMEIGTASLERLFEFSDEIRETKSSKELTKIAIDIYFRVGDPTRGKNSEKLYVAISFLDKALVINPRNRVAMENKVQIANALGDFDLSMKTINYWIDNQKFTYIDLMVKALIYEAIGDRDSSEVYFTQAKKAHQNTRFRSRDIEKKADLAIIESFLHGREAGLMEIQRLIDKTNHPAAHYYKEMYLDHFDRTAYINHFVLGKPLKEIIINLQDNSRIIIERGDTTVLN